MVTHHRATERHLPYEFSLLPATQHRWTYPTLTPAGQASTWFFYPGGIEGWVDRGDWLHSEMVYLSADSQTVTHPDSNHLIVTRPGVEPTTSWS